MDRTSIKPYSEIEFIVYGYTLPEVPNHDGYVKVGDTTRSAIQRVFEQVGTAGLNPNILFERQARKSDGTWFRDKDLHKFFKLHGIEKKDFNGRADEWFHFKDSISKAEELTDKFIKQDYDEVQVDTTKYSYVLRNEQQQAVERTYEFLKSNQGPNEFLWNAKPRFGKTLATYDFIRNLKAQNILIVTNRPAIANSWFEDFNKFIAWQEPQMKFISETDSLNGKAMTRSQYLEYLDTTSFINPSQITFISLQDLKGAKFAGGPYEKLQWVSGLNWDLLVIDEAHEGIDTKKTDIAFSQIKREFTLHLSGTPFKALANNKFSGEQIFNWSYLDEQESKKNWDFTLGSNPYENLPTLNLFTYQMSKMIESEISEGLALEEEKNVDYAFDLNEFFRVKDNGKFEYEESVLKFLDNISAGKFPFSEETYRNELNHTFWLLPRVNAAKALEKLLNNHPTFKEYKIILAAGDGISLNNDIEDEVKDVKETSKSFDKVRTAISKYEKTITLSVGQLTTGITIPEWTAVLMLNNIESPSLYFQAAFRSQNPYQYEKDGKIFRKENAYIFDFSPDRTLKIYEEFAADLSGNPYKTTEERKRKIKKLLNFFPVIAEDEQGTMHELDANEVLAIPTRITSKEVVKRGFMSNLLFANISGIFSGDSPYKEILDKISPEKNKRLEKRREISVNKPYLNENGEIEVPKEVIIGKSTELFGEKIYETIDDISEITYLLNKSDNDRKLAIENLSKDISDKLSSGLSSLKKSFKLPSSQAEKLKKTMDNAVTDIISGKHLSMSNQVNELERKYETKMIEAESINDNNVLLKVTQQYEEEKQKIEESYVKEINKEIGEKVNSLVKEQIERVEEIKKKTTEDDVRDHLRGFARTIPAFLMAYGDESTKLSNFERNIDADTFEELTSITIEEFKNLRDGFEYITDDSETKRVPGLFNEVVFNASIQEFMNTKNRLANYFDESIEEDIFDFIPSQKTNQIFTPKSVVQSMVYALEKENPNIFKDKNIKFVDLYTKSGLYITEVVKKLNTGLVDQIPNQQERIKWILENQVYACAPSNIIYNIVENFVYNNLDYVSKKNLLEKDTLKLIIEGKLSEELFKDFGDDNLRFDVIIGNPPYQEETIGDNKTYAPPVYHKFLEEAYELADKVIMIHPGRFLYNAGSTPKAWNLKMLSDKHLKVVDYFPSSSEVFPTTEIKGGIAITYRDKDKDFGEIGVFTLYKELNEILGKVESITSQNLDSLISGRGVYKLSKAAHEDYPQIENLQSKGHKNDIGSGAFKILKNIVFYEEMPQENGDYVKILGLENNRRVYYWMDKKYLNAPNSFDEFKVIIPQANGNGTFGEVISSPLVLEPNVGATETFLSIGGFATKEEAESALKYIKTKFARTLLSVLKITQANTRDKWSKVPMQNFSLESDIDWSKSISEIDQQLYKKYDLDADEIQFIEINVKEMH